MILSAISKNTLLLTKFSMFKSWELRIFTSKSAFKMQKKISWACYWALSSLILVFLNQKRCCGLHLIFSSHTNVTFVEAPSDKRQHLFCSIVQVGPAWGWVCAGPGSPLFRPLLFIPMSAPFATYHPPNSWHFLSIIHLSLIVNRISLSFFPPPLPNFKENGSYLISFWFARPATSEQAHTHTHIPSLALGYKRDDWLALVVFRDLKLASACVWTGIHILAAIANSSFIVFIFLFLDYGYPVSGNATFLFYLQFSMC